MSTYARPDQSRDSVNAYLSEIARYALLTPTQEINLSRQYVVGEELKKKSASSLSAADKRAIKRGDKAKQTLVNANLRLVVHVAKQYTRRLSGSNMELMDLVQEGAFGLTRAVELFDSTKGYKFSTYAYWWIRQAITRSIDSKERLIKVPQQNLDKVYKAERFRRAYMQEHGTAPTYQQMAEHVETSVDMLQMLMSRNLTHASLDAIVLDGDSRLLDLFEDENSTIRQLEYMEKDEKSKMLKIALNCLDETELHTISRRYGFGGAEPMTLTAMALDDGVSKERVRQRIALAHTKMRLYLNSTRIHR